MISNKTRTCFRRRSLLKSLGASVALTPFLPLLESRAEDAATPRRMVVFFSSNGTVGDAWDPTPGLALGTILSPLEAYKERLLFINGLRMECAHHGTAQAHAPGMNGCLTGSLAIPSGSGGEAIEHGLADGISVDQLIAGRSDGQKFGSLELGVMDHAQGGGALGHLSFAGPSQPVLSDPDPRSVYGRVFRDFDPGGGSNAAFEQLRADRKSVIDVVRGDLRRLEGQLGAGERQKMEAHLQAIRDIETALDVGGGPSLNPACEQPNRPAGLDSANPRNMPDVARAQIDLLAMTLACDLSRVVTIRMGEGGSLLTYDWLGHTTDHHTHAHNQESPQGRQALIEINTWMAEQFAYLLDTLDAIPEGNGSLLDHTVVLWVNELGDGTHSNDPMRMVMTGGGYFRTGRLLELSSNATDYNDMLVSLCHAMGATDVETFGDPRFCSGGPLSSLT